MLLPNVPCWYVVLFLRLHRPDVLGPAFSYKSYLSYIDGTMYGKEKPSTASEAFAALKVMLVAFGCVGTHLFLGGVYSMDVWLFL